jgi:nucleotide-binding universal stress UspA family protein
MKILVPVDGSINSLEALKIASDYVKLKGAEVFSISVVPFIGGMTDHEISPARRERHMDAMAELADEAVKKACSILSSENVTASCAKTVVTSVSVPDAIVDFAETEGINLIIMGSRGLSASSRFRMGSVASQVVKYSPCSVYLVRLPSGE